MKLVNLYSHSRLADPTTSCRILPTQQHSNTATQQSGNTRNTATRQNLNLSGTIIFKFLKVYIDEYKLVAWSLKVMLPSVGALHEALAATTNVALGER